MRIPEEEPVKQEAPEVISFKEEAIGYIEDELAQGYGLDQIKKELLDEGYPEEVVNFSIDYVAEHNKVSEHDKVKKIPKTDQHHHARRFHLPVLLILVLICGLIAVFFFTGVGSGEDANTPAKIDIDLYDKLGLIPGVHEITGSEQLFSTDYIVEKSKAENLLRQKSKISLLSDLKYSGLVTGFQKRATKFSISDGSTFTKVLVELRFQVSSDVNTLKIIESLPATRIRTDEIELTSGGIVADESGVLLFTFNNLEPGTGYEAVYLVEKEIQSLDSLTFAAEPKIVPIRADTAKTSKVCGDDKCMVGENFRSCCADCGCPQGFMCSRNFCIPETLDECRSDSECSDQDGSTKDTCTGTPKVCKNTPITQCAGDDSYCPPGCTHTTDNDCPESPAKAPVQQDSSQLQISGPQESPKISGVTITPLTVAIGDSITIEAKVTDANGKDDIAKVWFEVLELAQTHGEIGDMNDDGQDGDKAAGDDVYTTKRNIGEHYIKGDYHITVFAQDRSGNKKKSQKQFFVGEASISTPAATEIQNCGTDMICLADAAEECSPAKGTFTESEEFEGMRQTATSYIEIKGMQTASCRFYIRTERVDITLLEEYVQSMLSEGSTQEELDQEESEINAYADTFEGDDGTCNFDTQDLADMLRRWDAGDTSIQDWDVAECSGDYFG